MTHSQDKIKQISLIFLKIHLNSSKKFEYYEFFQNFTNYFVTFPLLLRFPCHLLCNLGVIGESYTHSVVDAVAVIAMEYGPHFDQNDLVFC